MEHPTFCSQLRVDFPISWILISVIAAPHFLYALAWISPLYWIKCFGSKSVTALASTIRVFFVFQAVAAVMWVWSTRISGLCFQAQLVPFTNWVFGIVMITLGLTLIRRAHSGYGTELLFYSQRLNSGRGGSDPSRGVKELASPPKVVTQPTKAHYVGTVLIVWGLIIGFWNQLPVNAWFLGAFLSLMYTITIVLEDYV
ncbi:hypothetical protein CEUSTIGMA_g6545.t1 [Chlamydomonas eustigma]|uniref:Uncharacterized protein n=1 Tax=Chlamydomonas eustigma TaxID=1157962 RepID=A0A250X7R5_9CHLO|nr:hypothetical protein CEUSTIGMA_g6545.t1 [Chlamydomonas eustigma]|eukprot:GAX79105.1 hypothetical protein CEUSTIGMA_g6545.t1 [Chlamydomonas eustigma]